MNDLLNHAGTWFQSHGLHPVLGGFAAGLIVAFLFGLFFRPPSRKKYVEEMAADAVRAMTDRSHLVSGSVSVVVNGRNIAIPPEDMEEILGMIRAGNMIEAIKAIRTSTNADLMEARHTAEALKKSDFFK